jgi:hypothetical protein
MTHEPHPKLWNCKAKKFSKFQINLLCKIFINDNSIILFCVSSEFVWMIKNRIVFLDFFAANLDHLFFLVCCRSFLIIWCWTIWTTLLWRSFSLNYMSWSPRNIDSLTSHIQDSVSAFFDNLNFWSNHKSCSAMFNYSQLMTQTLLSDENSIRNFVKFFTHDF